MFPHQKGSPGLIFNSPHASAICLFQLALVLLAQQAVHPTDASFYFAVKGIRSYSQTNAGAPIISGATPYRFTAQANMNCDAAITNGTLKMPSGNISNLVVQPTDSNWRLQSTFSNSAAMDAAFPNGTYKLNIYALRDGQKTNLTLYVTNTYPLTVPHISNYTNLQAVDSTTNLLITWDSWSGGTANDLIQLSIEDNQGTAFQTPGFGVAGALNGTANSFLIPSNSLAPGKTDYKGTLAFYRGVLNSSNYSSVLGFGGYYVRTDFSIQTIGSADTDAPSFFGSAPYDGETDVPLNVPVVFYFSKPMRASYSIDWGTNVNGCNFTYTWLSDQQTLVCIYKTNFPANATIAWTLMPTNGSGSFADLADNVLDISPVQGSFSTGTNFPPHDITNYIVAKGQLFVQDSTNAPSLDTNNTPFVFSSSVQESFYSALTNATVQLPAGRLVTLEPDYFEQDFPDQPSLDAAFPNGNYVFKLYTVHEGIRTATNVLTGNAYPNNPRVSNFASAQAVDSTTNFMLAWDAFVGGTITDFVRVDVQGIISSPDYGQPGALNGTNRSFLIPAGTLDGDQTYDITLLFAKITAVNSNAYPGVRGVSAYYKRTDVQLTTVPVPVPLEILTFSLPTATQSVFYTSLLEAAGGEPPYTWTALTPVPAGLGLSSGGTLAGTPFSSGATNISVQVTDATNATVSVALPLTIIASTNNPAPVLTAPARRTDGQFQFTFSTAPGVNYTILYSATLTNWTPLLTFNGSGGPITIIDPNAPGISRRFYRVRTGP